jgi:sugar phosphate isomerase/epimerase
MDRDERLMYTLLDACKVLKPDIVDIIMAVPFPVQRGPTMIERNWYRGDYAPFEHFQFAASRLKKFARAVAAIGAQMSIELHDDGLHDTADNCIKLMRMIDEPNVGLNPDVGNFHRVPYEYPQSWRDQVVKVAPYTNYFEIKNYRRIWHSTAKQFVWWATDVDLGDMDFRDAIQILWEAGFRGWVANEGGNGDFLAQSTRGDRIASELRFAHWFQQTRDEWLPLVSAALHGSMATDR